MLGTTALSQGGAFASQSGTGDISSGFDSSNTWGAVGSGRYGTIGHGAGTGGGYGVGGGRGGMRGRVADVENREGYKDYGRNAWTEASKDHLSTFAADVDTASYTLARRKLVEGSLLEPAAVRVEEFVNYFKYTLPEPMNGTPFGVAMDVAQSPFDPTHDVMRVAVATKAKAQADRKPAHLVFLVDVSGSMRLEDRLPLARRSLRILTDNLGPSDTVAIVTYAGSSELVLPATSVAHKGEILAAIEKLRVGGSTAMASGIDLAYQQAMQGLVPGAVSRVIVCTDGDANVGAHSPEEILKIIAGRAKQGVTLSTIGFGVGNYQDEMMEQLADKGNGNNFYIDSISQAHRVFEQQLGSTLEVVAKDVKLQVDFDASLVARYRLVGYENRDIADADFRNDRVDAGEVGAGHQVTAIYELELTAKGGEAEKPLATLRVRYKQPDGDKASEVAFPMTTGLSRAFADAPADVRFAVAVAAFADVLRGNKDWKLKSVREIAAGAAGGDADRGGFVELVDKAIALTGRS